MEGTDESTGLLVLDKIALSGYESFEDHGVLLFTICSLHSTES